jgi:hypothetical protein
MLIKALAGFDGWIGRVPGGKEKGALAHAGGLACVDP